MILNKLLLILSTVLLLTSPLQAKEVKWSKPPRVFGSYRPSKVPWHPRYSHSLSLGSRGGTPRNRFKNLSTARFSKSRAIYLNSTGYVFDPKTHGYNTTATGLWVKKGAVAVDPRVIPLGTYLYVEGYGFCFTCDVGGAIKGKRIDLVFPTKKLAFKHGRRRVKVWILVGK